MDICRNCKSHGEGFEQFGTKFRYCSKKCYEESYILVTTPKELAEVCQTCQKDILVTGRLVPLLIKLKEIPESLRKIYIKILKMLGFENIENPYEGDVDNLTKLIEGKLKDDNNKGIFSRCGVACEVGTGDVKDQGTVIIVAIIVFGIILCYAIYSKYDIEVEMDLDKKTPRVRLALRNRRDAQDIKLENS